MALQIQGYNNTVAEVDGTSFRALRTTARPIDYTGLGHYQLAMNSGILTAGLATGGAVFVFRWLPSDTSKLAVVNYISLQFQALTLFTAATLTDFGFDAFVGRGWTVGPTIGTHTAAVLTGNNAKCRTSMATSQQITTNQVIVSGTGAITVGTVTLDANPFANSIGDGQRVNPATGTEEQRVNDPTLIYSPSAGNGEHPLVLANQEGFILRNRTVWPAVGTGIVAVQVHWAEVTAY